MLAVDSKLSPAQQIIAKLDETARGVESQLQGLRAQMEAFSQEGAQAARELEAAKARVYSLTSRIETMNNGRMECARTATQADFGARILADIKQGFASGKLCGELSVESTTLGQGGAEALFMNQALNELMEVLRARGVPVSISCRTKELNEIKSYQVEWTLETK